MSYIDQWQAETLKRDKQLEKIAPWIGYLVMAFNELEEQLNGHLICEITNHDDFEEDAVGHAVIAGMSYSAKADLLGKIVRVKLKACGCSPSRLKKFKKIYDALKDANKQRNDIVHAAWEEYDIKTRTVKTKTKVNIDEGELDHITKKIMPRDIKKAHTFIINLADKLDEFFDADPYQMTRINKKLTCGSSPTRE
jgi:hypothetical protein